MRRVGTVGWLHHDVTHRGVTAWLLAAAILAFYLTLYYTEAFAGIIGDKWTFYGTIYTVAICGGGAFMIRKYRHNRYQIVRTVVVMIVQISFAFSVPLVLKVFDQPGYYFSYLWPLKVEDFYPSNILQLPLPFILYSVLGSLVMVPVLGLFFGKRWYCSWVCGCGGLANTAGEPFRHLTPSSSASWKFERISIHTVLVLCIVVTALVILSYAVGDRFSELASTSAALEHGYGLVVVTILSGIAGVALYPVGGTRVWCRNFCPMAALLGLVQKIGRFRIRVKKDMCISCGLCTTYCEMGIDVRQYAQANQDFTRAACVGCGLCEEVCPRGVLHLENVWPSASMSSPTSRSRSSRASLPILQ